MKLFIFMKEYKLTLSIIWNIHAAALLPTENASKFGAACPKFIAPINTAKNTLKTIILSLIKKLKKTIVYRK